VTKNELLHAVQQRYAAAHQDDGLTLKAIGEVLDLTFDQITKTVKKEGSLRYAGFGTWKLRKLKPRTGRNPQTGEKLKLKASRSMGFVAAAPVKRAL
jgi:DNA-binding protein HU-beta